MYTYIQRFFWILFGSETDLPISHPDAAFARREDISSSVTIFFPYARKSERYHTTSLSAWADLLGTPTNLRSSLQSPLRGLFVVIRSL